MLAPKSLIGTVQLVSSTNRAALSRCLRQLKTTQAEGGAEKGGALKTNPRNPRRNHHSSPSPSSPTKGQPNIHMHQQISKYIYIYIYTYTYTYTYTYMQMQHTYIYIYKYIYMYVSMMAFSFMHIYIYTHDQQLVSRQAISNHWEIHITNKLY